MEKQNLRWENSQENRNRGRLGKSLQICHISGKVHAVTIKTVTERQFTPATVEEIHETEIDQYPDFTTEDEDVMEIVNWAGKQYIPMNALKASIEDSYSEGSSEESDIEELIDTDEHMRLEAELDEEAEQTLFGLPGITQSNRNIPDSSDDEEESGHRYTYPYPNEDHFRSNQKEESDYYDEPPCKHCGVQNDHRNDCQYHDWDWYIESEKIQFLTGKMRKT